MAASNDLIFTDVGKQVIADLPIPFAVFQLNEASGDWFVVACSYKAIDFLFGGFKDKEKAMQRGVMSVMHPDDWKELNRVWEWANQNMGTRSPFFVRIRNGAFAISCPLLWHGDGGGMDGKRRRRFDCL